MQCNATIRMAWLFHAMCINMTLTVNEIVCLQLDQIRLVLWCSNYVITSRINCCYSDSKIGFSREVIYAESPHTSHMQITAKQTTWKHPRWWYLSPYLLHVDNNLTKRIYFRCDIFMGLINKQLTSVEMCVRVCAIVLGCVEKMNSVYDLAHRNGGLSSSHLMDGTLSRR